MNTHMHTLEKACQGSGSHWPQLMTTSQTGPRVVVVVVKKEESESTDNCNGSTVFEDWEMITIIGSGRE